MKTLWHPSMELSADESMVPSQHRRNPQHVFIKSKPYRHGIKIWNLADSELFVLDWNIYKRTDEEPRDSILQSSATPEFTRGPHTDPEPSAQTVFNLVENLEDLGHSIFADSYFGSLNIVEGLAARGHSCTCTCKANRPSFIFKDYLGPKAEDLEEHGDHVKAQGIIKTYSRTEIRFLAFWIKAGKAMKLLNTAFNAKTIQTTECTTPRKIHHSNK